jgi:hypothetical protein
VVYLRYENAEPVPGLQRVLKKYKKWRLLPEVGLQVFYVLVKSSYSRSGNPAHGLGVIVFKLFGHFYIAGFFQFIYLHAEVAGRSICFFFNKSKLRLFYADKK